MDHPNGGEVYLALGGSGGSRIFGAVAQVLLNLDWGYDVENSVQQARVHCQLSPAYVSSLPPFLLSRRSLSCDAMRCDGLTESARVQVSIESTFREDLKQELKNKGHNVTVFDINLGIAEVQAVLRDTNGRLFGTFALSSLFLFALSRFC